MTDQKDTITMSVPLFIRCLEWAKEDAKDDVEIHKFVEKILSNKNKILSTSDYSKFFKEEAPTNSAGNGNIAGIGVGPSGEPGINKKALNKYKKKNKEQAPRKVLGFVEHILKKDKDILNRLGD